MKFCRISSLSFYVPLLISTKSAGWVGVCYELEIKVNHIQSGGRYGTGFIL